MAIVDELVAILGFRLEGAGAARQWQQQINGAEKAALGLAASLGKVATVMGAAVATATGLLGNSVLKTAGQFEKFEATLETIEGSSEKAKKSMEWIKAFAKSTPYEVSELTDSFIKLKAYGIDPLDGTMETLGNTASAMGKTLNQAVEAYADASTGEFERLKEFGIKAKQEGDKVTFTYQQNGKEVTKTTSKSANEIQKFLKDTWGAKFAGAMDKQSKTWGGMLSNLSDSWSAFQLKIAESGFFEKAKGQLRGLMDLLERWSNDGTADKIAKVIGDAFSTMADIIAAIADRIATHLKFLNDNWETMGPYVKAVGIALGVLAAYAFPLIAIFAGLALVVDDVLTYFEGGESITGKLVDWFKQLGVEIGKSIDAIKQWIKDTNINLQLWADSWIEAGKNMGRRLLEGLKSVGADIKQWFMDLIPDWAKNFFGIGQGTASAGQGGGTAQRGVGTSTGVYARAGRSSGGYRGRVPIKGAEAGELKDAIIREAKRIGANPEDLATLISFETAGTFNKDKAGPTTQHGQHRGLIQWGETQRRQFGVDTKNMSYDEQMRRVGDYMIANGYKPGMTGAQLYATVNAGSPYKTGASDAKNGGTWGSAADKWNYQMAGHRANAKKLLSLNTDEFTNGGDPAVTNAQRLLNRQKALQSYGAVQADKRAAAQSVQVNAPVTVNVKEATDAPKAAAQAVGNAVENVQPSRMQTGGSF